MQDDHNDTAKRPSLDGLKDHPLKAAGYAYLVGDISLAVAGALSGTPEKAAAGLLWAAGGLACARYGNPGAEKHLKLLNMRLSEFLDKQGIVIPASADTELLAHRNGVIDKIEGFFYEHPSQMLNAAYAIGGSMMLHGGLKATQGWRAKGLDEAGWQAASGALITSGALTGLLVQERRPDSKNPPKGPFAKAASWVQEKPLRVSGLFFGLNNIPMALEAYHKMRKNPENKSYLFQFLTVASYVFANSMLTQTSKHRAGNTQEETAVIDNLATASAAIIAAQPPQIQEALVTQISHFLAAGHGVHLKSEEINSMLHRKMQEATPAPSATAENAKGWASRTLRSGLESINSK